MSNYYVTKNQNRTWNTLKEHSVNASRVFDTQKQAEALAKILAGNTGGGEVRIQGKDYRFRDSDTVKPGNESSVRDKKL